MTETKILTENNPSMDTAKGLAVRQRRNKRKIAIEAKMQSLLANHPDILTRVKHFKKDIK